MALSFVVYKLLLSCGLCTIRFMLICAIRKCESE